MYRIVPVIGTTSFYRRSEAAKKKTRGLLKEKTKETRGVIKSRIEEKEKLEEEEGKKERTNGDDKAALCDLKPFLLQRPIFSPSKASPSLAPISSQTFSGKSFFTLYILIFTIHINSHSLSLSLARSVFHCRSRLSDGYG